VYRTIYRNNDKWAEKLLPLSFLTHSQINSLATSGVIVRIATRGYRKGSRLKYRSVHFQCSFQYHSWTSYLTADNEAHFVSFPQLVGEYFELFQMRMKPGSKWLNSFVERQEKLNRARADIANEEIRPGWLATLKDVMAKYLLKNERWTGRRIQLLKPGFRLFSSPGKFSCPSDDPSLPANKPNHLSDMTPSFYACSSTVACRLLQFCETRLVIYLRNTQNTIHFQ
jgi:hypothetical protein